jgi:hypothetical protein
MKLSNIKLLGRYINPETNRAVNVHIGKRVNRSTDHLFYYFRQKRVFISMADFYGGKWQKESIKNSLP